MAVSPVGRRRKGANLFMMMRTTVHIHEGTYYAVHEFTETGFSTPQPERIFEPKQVVFSLEGTISENNGGLGTMLRRVQEEAQKRGIDRVENLGM